MSQPRPGRPPRKRLAPTEKYEVYVPYIRDILGHADLSTTEIYANSRELHQTGEKPQVVSAGWPSEWYWRTTRTAA